MGMWSCPTVPPRVLAAAEGPLVGRRSEFELLEDTWVQVTGGSRQAVFVGGDPGAGKTRLVAEVGATLSHHDVAVLVGTSGADYAPPYQPFVEMLDHLFTSCEPGSLDHVLEDRAIVLERLTPSVRPHLPSAADEGDPNGDDRTSLFTVIARLIRSLAADRPVALVFEDLHWAQAPTLALLSHVITSVVDARLLVLGTFRTTAPDRSDDLTHAIADLYRLPGVRRVDLAGLGTDDVAEFLQREGGVDAATARRSAMLLRDQTGGNPFFLRELWRELEQRGGLAALHSGKVPAPRSVGDTIERRLAGLGPATREVLELAAVTGDVFDVTTLATAGATDPTHVLAAVDAAAAIGLVEPVADDPGTYAFVHALSRQAVLERLAPSMLARLHAQAGAALEARSADPVVVPHLAHHYLRSHILGYGKQAIHYATEAARLAERSLAHEEAAQWYQRAAAVPDADPSTRIRLLLSAAANQIGAGRFEHARAIYEQLSSSPDPETRLAAAMGYEDASWRPGRPGHRPADLLMEALTSTALPADDPRYIRALGSLGRALTFAGDTPRARQVGEQAIELARTRGDPALLAHTLLASLWNGLQPERARAMFERSGEVVERVRRLGDHDMLESALYFRAMTSYILGQREDVETSIREFHRSTAVLRGPLQEYVGGCMELGRTFLQGDLVRARAQAERLVELGQPFGVDDVEGSYGLQVFMIEREAGLLDSVRHLVTGDESFQGMWVPGLLALYTELDLRPGMQRALPHVLASFDEDRTAGSQWPAELAFTAEAALALGDLDAIARVRPWLHRFEGLNLVTGEFVATFGAADRYLARVAALTGEHAQAERWFQSALAMDRRMGATLHVAETLLHHGRFLLTRGDGARAQQLLDEARVMAEGTGHQRVLRRLPARKRPDGPDGLTEREVEVLRLLAEGLSNREIGRQLYISANTAANHVRSILMKTGAANRTQAAMYAADHDLV